MSLFTIKSRHRSSPIAELFGEFQRAALEFVYPANCLLCHVEIPRSDSSPFQLSSLCLNCLSKLMMPAGNACLRCGAPVGPFVVANDHCILCRREAFAFDEVIRLGLYRDELRVACLIAKSPAGALLGQVLADLLVDTKQSSLTAHPIDAIVPVPEHWIKRVVRPHYAPETIARRLSARLKVELWPGILAKARWTPKQAKSLPVQRRQQQKNAFRIVGNRVRGKTILLVDDILTTGATADAAARELKRAGASRIVVAVIAVSPPRA